MNGENRIKKFTGELSKDSVSISKSFLVFSPVALRTAIGLRYFITDNICFAAEVGIGGPIMQAGFSYKF